MAHLDLDADELSVLTDLVPKGTPLHRKLAHALTKERQRSEAAARPSLDDVEWLRRRRLDEGATAAQIAEEAGCNTTSVWRAFNRHGIPARGHPQKLNAATRRQLRDLLAQRLPITEIARRLGVDRATVYRWRKQL